MSIEKNSRSPARKSSVGTCPSQQQRIPSSHSKRHHGERRVICPLPSYILLRLFSQRRMKAERYNVNAFQKRCCTLWATVPRYGASVPVSRRQRVSVRDEAPAWAAMPPLRNSAGPRRSIASSVKARHIELMRVCYYLFCWNAIMQFKTLFKTFCWTAEQQGNDHEAMHNKIYF